MEDQNREFATKCCSTARIEGMLSGLIEMLSFRLNSIDEQIKEIRMALPGKRVNK